ncbi:hypothetical protein DFP72DRAFT_840225 [Ephemerocybe angulata]|uniref:Uncharacterized protein n=1 Tax=Ephemerocybe angulata TaxID=980116 RepID=A0A8H6IEM1_9AGAR|nr:hypothetical protein DFP72DRAFT_840225 [Tulosesus angulatus]
MTPGVYRVRVSLKQLSAHVGELCRLTHGSSSLNPPIFEPRSKHPGNRVRNPVLTKLLAHHWQGFHQHIYLDGLHRSPPTAVEISSVIVLETHVELVVPQSHSTTAIEPHHTASPVPRLFQCNDVPTEEERLAILGCIEIVQAKLDNLKLLAVGGDITSTHDGSGVLLEALTEHHIKLLNAHRALLHGFEISRHSTPPVYGAQFVWDQDSSYRFLRGGQESEREAFLWLKRTATLYLERSGVYPLTFTFHVFSGIDDLLLPEFESLFMALVAHCRRWANVDLRIIPAMLTKVSGIAGHLPLLRSLSLNMRGVACQLDIGEESKLLENLPWSQLKTFTINYYSSLGGHTYGKDNMDINAITSILYVGTGGRAYLETQLSPFPPSRITELDIEITGYADTGPECIRYIVEELTLPSLTNLRLSISSLALGNDNYHPFSHALPLIRRSGCSLKRLEDIGSGCVWCDSAGALVEVLELSEALEELVYGLTADALKALLYEVNPTYRMGPLVPNLRVLKMHIPEFASADLHSSILNCSAINAMAKSRCGFQTPSSEVANLSLEIHAPNYCVSRHAFHMLENELSSTPILFSFLLQDEMFKDRNIQLQRVGNSNFSVDRKQPDPLSRASSRKRTGCL